jgi:hypothetical protein
MGADEIVLWLACIITVFVAASILRLPDINSESFVHRRDWPIPPRGERQRRTCIEAAYSFRAGLKFDTSRLLGRTLLSALIPLSGLAAYSVFHSKDPGDFARLYLPYVTDRVSNGFGLFGPIYDSALPMSRPLERFLDFTFGLVFGAWVIYLISFAWSLVVSRLFPVRWMKWAKVAKTTGSHNWLWRLQQRAALVVDYNARVTPKRDDKYYGIY